MFAIRVIDPTSTSDLKILIDRSRAYIIYCLLLQVPSTMLVSHFYIGRLKLSDIRSCMIPFGASNQ